jgi:hypothetical protein
MTAQEKAIDLLDKADIMPNKVVLILNKDEYFESLKKCALLVVNEILSTYDMRLSANNIKYVYWHNVKQEIEKL